METQSAIWLAYLLGAFLTLAEEARRYVYTGKKKKGKSSSESLKEWLFDPTVSNISSWVTTIGAVWVGGYIYINKIPGIIGFNMPSIDVAAPVAFMIGCLMEVWAPKIVEFFASKMPHTGKGEK